MAESGLRVLVIDADKNDSERVGSLILAEGHAAATANDTGAALAQAEQFRPNLVLFDPLVPGAPSFELLRNLKLLPATRRSPIVLLMRLARPTDLERSLVALGVGELPKPVELEALRARLLLTQRSRSTIERYAQIDRALLSEYEANILSGLFRGQALAGAPALARHELVHLLAEEQLADGRRDVTSACLVLDFEQLDAVQWRLGRSATDDVRRAMIDAIRQHTRTGDLLTRYGQDELAVLLPSVSYDGAQIVAAKLQAVVGETSARLPGVGELTPGVGVVHFTLGQHQPVHTLLAQVERALLEARLRPDLIALLEAAS